MEKKVSGRKGSHFVWLLPFAYALPVICALAWLIIRKGTLIAQLLSIAAKVMVINP